MDLSLMDSHYTEIASKFNHMFEPLHQETTPLIINKLQLTPDDVLLDVGAATGQLAHFIWKQVGLKNPVTCVEPCKALVEHARKVDGIVPVLSTAEEFYDHVQDYLIEKNQKPFNKVLVCGAIHHLKNLNKCIGQVIDCLPKNGVCLVLNEPHVGSSMPFTPLQLQHLEELPEAVDEIVPYVKSRDDVITEVIDEVPTFKIPKSKLYYMIRNHFWSTFSRYTDDEIEESIKELDNSRFEGVKDDEFITVVNKYIGVKMTKK